MKYFFFSAKMEEDIKLSDHFPLVRPQCKQQAAKFFYCFTKTAEATFPKVKN